jgi:hypothetical protein
MSYIFLIDLVLAATVVEVLFLLALWHFFARGIAPRNYLANVCSGAALMLALRAATQDAHWLVVAAFLCLAGVVHLIDVLLRWESGGARTGVKQYLSIDLARLHEFALEKRIT